MSLSSEDSAALATAKENRTKGLKEVKRAASALQLACKLKQSDPSPKALEESYVNFCITDGEYKSFCSEKHVAPAEAIVNKLDPTAYSTLVQTYYDTAIAEFKSYMATLPESKPKATVVETKTITTTSDHVTSTPSNSLFRNHRCELLFWPGRAGREWYEFKTHWVNEVFPNFKENKPYLARLLRKQISGEAKKEIEHLSLEDGYDAMWKALVAKYDNVALNVHVVMTTLDSLKAPGSSDRAGLLKLVRDINAAHSQLKSLEQVSLVDSKVVGKLASLLPVLMQEEWALKYSALNSKERFHPFKEFVEWLGTKEAMLEALVEIDLTMNFSSKLSSSSTPRANRGQARSHHQQSAPAKSICVMHPQSTHTTPECRKFLKMSCRDRYNLCDSKNLCKRCVNPKHGSCTGKCTYCVGDKAGTHCDLLCFSKEEESQGKSGSIAKPYGNQSDRPFQPPRGTHATGCAPPDLHPPESPPGPGGPPTPASYTPMQLTTSAHVETPVDS